MQIICKRQVLKFGLAFGIVLFLWLSVFIQMGRASTHQQTIPTAPPTTIEVPTLPPSKTPANPPPTAVGSIQPTRELPSATPGLTMSPTTQVTYSSTGIAPTPGGATETGMPPSGSATSAPTGMKTIPPTVILQQTPHITPAMKTNGASVILYILLGGGILVLLIIGVVRLLRIKR